MKNKLLFLKYNNSAKNKIILKKGIYNKLP